jgi:predicted oxidoreductase
MIQMKIGGSSLETSPLILGCMRIHSQTREDIANLVNTALELGVNMIDHADIYGGGESERKFAEAIGMNAAVRKNLFIQSKSCIRKGYYDCSAANILQTVDGILQRLKTDYLDLYLMHRPDALMEPEEIAIAFDKLYASGKVRHFGVSNQNAMQMELMSKCIKQPLIANQLQFGIMHSGMVDSGINANMVNDGSLDRDGHILEYCRIHNITIQAWSPLQFGFFEGTFLGKERFARLNAVLDRIAQEKNVTSGAVAVAWILRHPAKMQVILGTTNAKHLAEMVHATQIMLTRQEWYEIYLAEGNTLP